MPNNLVILGGKVYSCRGQEDGVFAGDPQGSIFVFLLRNLADDGMLELDVLPRGIETLAYADNLTLLFTAKTESTLQDKAFNRVMQWIDRHHLKLAPDLTTSRLRFRRLLRVCLGFKWVKQ